MASSRVASPPPVLRLSSGVGQTGENMINRYQSNTPSLERFRFRFFIFINKKWTFDLVEDLDTVVRRGSISGQFE